MHWALSWIEKSPIRITGSQDERSTSLIFFDHAFKTFKDIAPLRTEISLLVEITKYSAEHWNDSLSDTLSRLSRNELSIALPTDEHIQRFLRTIGQCIGDLVNGPIAEVGPMEFTFRITRKHPPRNPSHDPNLCTFSNSLNINDSDSPFSSDPHFVDGLIYHVAESLQACGGLVEVCPECSKLFLAEKKIQAYCSVACQSRVTSREYRRLRAMKTITAKSPRQKRKNTKKGKP